MVVVVGVVYYVGLVGWGVYGLSILNLHALSDKALE